jgi:hypothetical protein
MAAVIRDPETGREWGTAADIARRLGVTRNLIYQWAARSAANSPAATNPAEDAAPPGTPSTKPKPWSSSPASPSKSRADRRVPS